MRMRSLAPILAALALAAGPPALAADCPTSSYLYGSLDPATLIPGIPASHDTTFTIHGCDRVHGHSQVNAGLLIASVDFACSVDSYSPPAGLETIVEDDFTVSGPPDGTPLTFDAVLDLTGSALNQGPPGGGGGGRVRGLIREGAANEVSVLRATSNVDASVGVSESLMLPVSGLSGTPLHLRFAVRAEALDGRASMEGLFRFANLPPGAIVRSCRGYASDAPVRSRATTWGALKSLYR